MSASGSTTSKVLRGLIPAISVGAGVSSASATGVVPVVVAAPPRVLGLASSTSPCTIAPTAPPYAACSPEPSSRSCSGLYTPWAIAFCITAEAASCPASTPPCATTRLRPFNNSLAPSLPNDCKNLIGKSSNAPGIIPRKAAKLRSS